MPNSITLKPMHMIIGNYIVITVASSELNFCEGGLGVCVCGGGGNDSRVFFINYRYCSTLFQG